MEKAEIWNFSTSLQLDISQVSAVISTSCKPCKIVKMVNVGKEIEHDKKWNKTKLGPCMNVFLNFDPYTSLDLFHPKNDFKKDQILKK